MEEITIQKVLTQSSVNLATDSKGKIKIDVKVYADTIEEASDGAQEAFDKLKTKYSGQMP